MVDQTWVVIAAYNESSALRAVVESVRGQFRNVVVVDDGSSDETALEARDAGATVLRHVINLGQGAALQTGITYALRQGASSVATFDADGQHRVADLIGMIDKLRESRADVVLGSRFLGEAIGMSNTRWLTLKLAILFTWAASGIRLTDAHNGLRVFSRRGAEMIDIKQNRMAHASEIIDLIRISGMAYVEYPVVISYSDYSKSKGQGFFGAFHILADLILKRIAR